MNTKKTLVLGASSNPEQYSHMAVKKLIAAGHPVEAIGKSPINIDGIQVETDKLAFENIHTVTLYLNPQRQEEYESYIISLHPSRIIFNPGAENEPFKALAEKEGIETINACTLVLLSTGAY
jgi:predicted CoA-binding protein